MKRVLHIISNIKQDSGVMNVIMNYYRNIDKSKIQFDFLYFGDKDEKLLEEIRNLGGIVYYIEKPSLKRIISIFNIYNRFFEDVKKIYKIIHLHEIYLVNFIKIFAVKYNMKLFTHAHTINYADNPVNAFRNRLMCQGVSLSSDKFLACSKDAAIFYYGKKAYLNGKVQIIKNGIDLNKYKFNVKFRSLVRKKYGLEKNFIIGHIGRMVVPKNQKFLLEIFVEILKVKKNAIMLIIGDGPLKKELQHIARRLGIEKNLFIVEPCIDVYKFYSAMDVFVLPSLYEGLGNVLIEAQANGLPCIASNFVPFESNLGNCKFLSLKGNKIQWIDAIVNSSRNILYNENKIIDYNISNCVRVLEKCYLNVDRR